jgi:hypothetical protein
MMVGNDVQCSDGGTVQTAAPQKVQVHAPEFWRGADQWEEWGDKFDENSENKLMRILRLNEWGNAQVAEGG